MANILDEPGQELINSELLLNSGCVWCNCILNEEMIINGDSLLFSVK